MAAFGADRLRAVILPSSRRGSQQEDHHDDAQEVRAFVVSGGAGGRGNRRDGAGAHVHLHDGRPQGQPRSVGRRVRYPLRLARDQQRRATSCSSRTPSAPRVVSTSTRTRARRASSPRPAAPRPAAAPYKTFREPSINDAGDLAFQRAARGRRRRLREAGRRLRRESRDDDRRVAGRRRLRDVPRRVARERRRRRRVHRPRLGRRRRRLRLRRGRP